MSAKSAELVGLAHEAIGDWTTYVTHIAERLSTVAEHFRMGEDVQAVDELRSAVDDLGSFVVWMSEIRGIVEFEGGQIPEAAALEGSLIEGARRVRDALARDDFAEAADEIDGTLIHPLISSQGLVDRIKSQLPAAA